MLKGWLLLLLLWELLLGQQQSDLHRPLAWPPCLVCLRPYWPGLLLTARLCDQEVQHSMAWSGEEILSKVSTTLLIDITNCIKHGFKQTCTSYLNICSDSIWKELYAQQ